MGDVVWFFELAKILKPATSQPLHNSVKRSSPDLEQTRADARPAAQPPDNRRPAAVHS